MDYGDGQTQAYSFDAMGNRLQKQDSGAGTENYSYNSANMLLTRGASNYTNDASGNTLTGGGRTNTWDSQNRLVQCVNGANTSSFVYGADGQRRQSTVNSATTDFVLDASMFIRERNHATGVNTATYFVGARGPEYRRDETTGQVRWYVYDGLGSVLGEVDPNGNITSSRKYDVYGLVRGGSNPGGTSSHKFVGQLGHPSEDNTGLIYMQARYCDPTTGRFISEDPAKDGNNWTLYCDGNPINARDSTGKWIDVNFLVQYLWDILCGNAQGRMLTSLALEEAANWILARSALVRGQANAALDQALLSEVLGASFPGAMGAGFESESALEFQKACTLESQSIMMMFLSEQLRELAMLMRIDKMSD